MKPALQKIRCLWANSHDLLRTYHDKEWGIPVHDDRLLFEMLNLEGAQAGLSWLTVLKKRAAYRKAFGNFNAKKIAAFGAAEKKALMANEGIVRNRLKIDAVIENAKAFLEIKRERGSFDRYVWEFSGWRALARDERREAVEISETMSKALRKRGFRFVGPTICFAFMQAIGMIDDHSHDCFRAKKSTNRPRASTRKTKRSSGVSSEPGFR